MFPSAIIAAAQAQALAEFPREAVGLVLEQGEGFAYLAVENVAADPLKHFAIAPETQAQYQEIIAAVIHSHPMAAAAPSEADMTQQQAMLVPWGIIATDGKGCRPTTWFGHGTKRSAPKQPIMNERGIGRGFIHGWQDCLSLIIDWHAGFGVSMPDQPRDWEWWLAKDGEPAKDFYRDLFEPYGFELIDGPVPGATFFAALGYEVNDQGQRTKPILRPNHGGIHLGDGVILHHRGSELPIDAGRLAAKQPLGRWVRFFNGPITWVRHRDLPADIRA
jgi:proteasome lid subunit RPN8/RPN11